MNGGWFPDPSGRFTQRWFDGRAWSEHVVGANGTAVSDPLPSDAPPMAPPIVESGGVAPSAPPAASAASAASAVPAGQPAPAAPTGVTLSGGAPAAGPVVSGAEQAASFGPGGTLAVAGVGVLMFALSLLALPWAKSVSFLDLNEAVRGSFDPTEEPIVTGYVLIGAFLALAVAVWFVIKAGLPGPRTDRWRIWASAGAAFTAVIHAITMARLFRGPADPGAGAWIGLIGLFLILAAMIWGHYLPKSPAPSSSLAPSPSSPSAR